MPAPRPEALHDLKDFAGFLEQLDAAGIEFAVIGGCAVGAYAHLNDETVLSGDLDIFVTGHALGQLLQWAPRHGIEVHKRPQPRSVPVAVLYWDGKEINALTASSGLPEPEIVVRTAREFRLREHGDFAIPVADPFDLLVNKLAVARDKDLPHIEVLKRFLEEEVVMDFDEEVGRKRLRAARRYLDALERQTLPAELAERLIPLARLPSDHRFLISTVPTEHQARRVLERVRGDSALHDELREILGSRSFDV